MRFIFYLMVCLYLVFSLLNCDGREIALDIDLPTEEPKLVVDGILTTNDYASIQVQRTLLINNDSLISANIPDAEVTLWENDEIFSELIFRSDTSRSYEIWGNDTVRSIITSIHNLYHSTERLQLTPGYAYHITASAEGYPDVISDQVMAQERTTVTALSNLPAEDGGFGSIIFPEIVLHINNSSSNEERIQVEYFPWRADLGSLASDDYRVAVYLEDFDGEIEDSLIIKYADIEIFDFIFFNENDCLNGCHMTTEGTEIIVTTINQDLKERIESTASNSEYLGGFYPTNPFIKHNINGGYGFFSIVEQDTLLVIK